MSSKQKSAVHALAAFVSLLVAVASPAVKAEVVFGNLGPSGTPVSASTNVTITSPAQYVQGFTTGTSNLTLQTVSTFLRVGSGAQNVSAVLWSESGGNPGSILATSSPLAVSNTPGAYTFSFGSGYELSPTESYFIGLIPPSSGTSLRWYTTPSPTVLPGEQNDSGYVFLSTQNTSNSSSGPWTTISSPEPAQGLQISITAVPEPHSLALLGTGIVAVAAGVIRRRRVAAKA